MEKKQEGKCPHFIPFGLVWLKRPSIGKPSVADFAVPWEYCPRSRTP
jgi:hypothetical protein